MFQTGLLTMQFILFGLTGIFAEVIFGSLKDLVANRSYALHASTSLWLFPIYGLIAFIYPPLQEITRSYDWYIRGAIYMFAFYIVEFTTGWILLKVTKDHVWQYNSKYSIQGLVSLSQAPVWFLAGLGIEKIYPYIIKIARILG